jgi:hypothetical protein
MGGHLLALFLGQLFVDERTEQFSDLSATHGDSPLELR